MENEEQFVIISRSLWQRLPPHERFIGLPKQKGGHFEYKARKSYAWWRNLSWRWVFRGTEGARD